MIDWKKQYLLRTDEERLEDTMDHLIQAVLWCGILALLIWGL